MDKSNRRPKPQRLTSGHIQGLAKDALNVARGNLNPEASKRIESASDWLERFCLSNKFDAGIAVETITSRGLHPDAIVDYCIPRVARKYGEEWAYDTLSFATVTAGCAHLQLILKHIINARGVDVQDGNGKCLLLAAVAPEQHTLGALVLADQLRRMGYSVKMGVRISAAEVSRYVEQSKFHAVLFSASSVETVLASAQCVNQIRQNYKYQPLIFLGGSVITSHRDITSREVFDYVTNKLDDIVNSIEDATHSVVRYRRQ